MRARALQRFFDALAQHEMRAEQSHGLARGGAHRRQAEPLHQRLNDALRRLAGMDNPGGNAERPRRSRHPEGGRARVVMRPIAAAELVLDEGVCGLGVGDPQAERRLRQ